MTVPLERQIKCVKRELAMRQRVYPGWVKNGRMKLHEAADELGAMEAVLATLEAARAAQAGFDPHRAPALNEGGE